MVIQVYEDSIAGWHAVDPEFPDRLVDFRWNAEHTSYDPAGTQIAVREAIDAGASIEEHVYPNSWFPAPHVPTLDEAKETKRAAIDTRTRELIFAGCPYGDKLYSMDVPDQMTWTNLFNVVSAEILVPPITVVATDGTPLVLETVEAFMQMYTFGIGWVQAILNSGRDIKYAVNACTTVEEVEAIIDPR